MDLRRARLPAARLVDRLVSGTPRSTALYTPCMPMDAPTPKYCAIRRGRELACEERAEGAEAGFPSVARVARVFLIVIVLGTWALVSGPTWLGVLVVSLCAFAILIWFWRRRVRAAKKRQELHHRLDDSRRRREDSTA